MTENENIPRKQWVKGSPKFAIPQHVADIALQYGNTVSKGIQNMENIIKEKKE